MLLKSRRSTRCPYLFLSTDLAGAADDSALGRTTWKSSGDSDTSLGVAAVKGAPAPEKLVLVEVRDRGGGFENWRDGDGVSKDLDGRVWVVFQAGAQVGANLEDRKISGNLAIR